MDNLSENPESVVKNKPQVFLLLVILLVLVGFMVIFVISRSKKPTLLTELTPDQRDQIPSQFIADFPIQWMEKSGAYGFPCTIDQVNYEANFEFETGWIAISTAQCYFYNSESQKTFITIPLAITKIEENTSLLFGTLPKRDGVYPSNLVPRFLETMFDFQGPGHTVTVTFAMPNDINSTSNSEGYMNDAVEAMYTEKQLSEFAATGDSNILGGFILPFSLNYKSTVRQRSIE